MRSNFRPNIGLAANLLLVLFFLNLNNYSLAHIGGILYSQQKAINRSLELRCEGIYKNKDKWIPCKNEKELHIDLRK